MPRNRKMIYSALCVAAGVILPMLFHAVPDAGRIFSPMHLPILLAGLLTDPLYGLAAGFLTPLLSSLLTGMPPAALLPSMVIELAVYGLAAGLFAGLVKAKERGLGLFIALVLAMLAGRIAGGLMNALVFRAGQYSFGAWISAYFLTGLPGIAVQLILIPAVIYALNKAKLI